MRFRGYEGYESLALALALALVFVISAGYCTAIALKPVIFRGRAPYILVSEY
jgi:hypothetical protein